MWKPALFFSLWSRGEMKKKRIKSIIAFSLLMFLLLAGGLALRNVFLVQIKKRIESVLHYGDLHLHLFPPALVLEDVRAISPSPFFSAKSIRVEISYPSLLSREKPLRVYIEEPIFRISDAPKESRKREPSKVFLSLPFTIEKGLIREGEVFYGGEKIRFHSRGIRALFTQKKDFYFLQAKASENSLSTSSFKGMLEGSVDLVSRGRGKELSVEKLTFKGEGFVFKAKGKILDLESPAAQLKTYFSGPIKTVDEFFGLPFDWEGQTEAEGELRREKGKISFLTNFSTNDLVLNKAFMGNALGRLELGEKRVVELAFLKKYLPREMVRIDFSSSRILGEVENFHLDPIIAYFSLPWPVKSAVWGRFFLENGQFEAHAEFKDKELTASGKKFPFQGTVHFTWDGKSIFSFQSQELQSSFATLNVKGKVNMNQDTDILIQGGVKELREAREFTSLILSREFKFPEIRGKGEAEVKILGQYRSPEIKILFSLSPAGFDKFEVASASGILEIAKEEVIGKFKVDDPLIKGEIDLLAQQNGIRSHIRLSQGLAEEILPALNIRLPLKGWASGEFEVSEEGNEISLHGDFSSPRILFSNQELKKVKGTLEWNNHDLSFPELEFDFSQGKVKGNASINYLSKSFALDVEGEAIDFSFLSPKARGELRFFLKGKGWMSQDVARGKFFIQDLLYPPFQKTEASGEMELKLNEKSMSLKLDGNFSHKENHFTISIHFPFVGNAYSLDIKGSHRDLDLLLPWKGARGKINYIAELKSSGGVPRVNGVVDFEGSLLPFPKFAHALTDYSGLIFIQEGKLSLRSFKGILGGGEVQGWGTFEMGKEGIKNIDISAEGKNMLLSPLERTRVLADGVLRLIKDEARFVLEGNFNLPMLSWRREINEKFAFSSSSYFEAQREPNFFDDLTLNIRLKAGDNAWMENSLGKVKGNLDLTIMGNISSPIILGDIIAESGEVYFQDRRFRILKARLSFFNPSTVEPYLDFKGETYVKDYRVTISLTGLVNHLKPEFSSSPPLPPEDVLALLALGESFKRTYSSDRSFQLSTASLLSFQIADEAKKRAERLFSLDRFRIDPFVIGSSAEMTARLSVGKKVSRNLFILYSTNLTTQREEIVRLDWEIREDFSIVGIRDELGRISFDVKIRKRF